MMTVTHREYGSSTIEFDVDVNNRNDTEHLVLLLALLQFSIGPDGKLSGSEELRLVARKMFYDLKSPKFRDEPSVVRAMAEIEERLITIRQAPV